MLPRSEYRPRHSRSYKRDLNPVILRWIAGFFHSTGFCIFHSAPSDGDGIRQRRLPLYGGRSFLQIRRRTSLPPDLYGVDHRPSDFDLSLTHSKIEIGGLP